MLIWPVNEVITHEIPFDQFYTEDQNKREVQNWVTVQYASIYANKMSFWILQRFAWLEW